MSSRPIRKQMSYLFPAALKAGPSATLTDFSAGPKAASAPDWPAAGLAQKPEESLRFIFFWC